MRKGILTNGQEPTDEELAFIMHEMMKEVIRKAQIAKQKLDDEIKELVKQATEAFNK